MKKIIFAVAAVMVLSLSLLVGCDGSGDAADIESGVGVENPTTLEGTTWEVIRVEADGEQITPTESSASLTVTFKDGEATLAGNGQSRPIPYTYDEGYLDIEGTTCDVRGETIIIKEGDITMTMVIKK